MAIPTDAQIQAAINRTIAPDALTFVHYPDYTWVGYSKGANSAKLEFHDGWVNWTDIQTRTGGTQWLRAAHDWVRAEFAALGVTYLLAGISPAEDALKANAPWRRVDGRLRWDL